MSPVARDRRRRARLQAGCHHRPRDNPTPARTMITHVLSQLASASLPQEPTSPAREPDAERVRPYIPRAFQQQLVDDPTAQYWTAEGTAAFVDISGFTQLSEQLARKGREGAEQITDAIGGSF